MNDSNSIKHYSGYWWVCSIKVSSNFFIYYTVGLQLSEHVGTEGCSDNWNVG